jgi:WD40 repeat protein
MPQQLRVFVSSPGDVAHERLRADLVIEKLAQDYSRYFVLETYRWEHEPMLASGHFQDSIEPPSKFDIVILILWSRLGSLLPEKTAVREYRGIDNNAPVTGTQWEYEEALQEAIIRGAPDLLAFRNVNPAPIDTGNPDARAQVNAQLDALDAFWKRHFANRGVFLSAYDEYRSLEEFAKRLEDSLRKLLDRRIEKIKPTTQVWSHAPFRGLESYEFEHAPIYFGRDGLVTKATEQIAARAVANSAFLLVSGGSGSGKSSLVKAALLPRFMKPQRIQGTAFRRRVVFRPAEMRGQKREDGQAADIFDAFANALVRQSPDNCVGVPELLAPGQNAEKFAAHLRTGGDAGYTFENALGQLTRQERDAKRILAFESVKLILLVDQLEELFTIEEIPVEAGIKFIELLASLARSGSVWVVATMRADFWHLAMDVPALIALSENQGRIDIPPASLAEIGEMIRRPAQAAGLTFETHSQTHLTLDAVIAAEATAEPGVLPLLSFTLDALYAKDITEKQGNELTYATYESLGGLKGAIANRAEEVVAKLPPHTQSEIPRVLRALTTVGGLEQKAVGRSTPLAEFDRRKDARAVVDALIGARLLVASDEAGIARVGLAHEALLTHWKRASEQLVADRRDLETRALVERQLARWKAAAGPAQQQLLLRDPDLANATDLVRRWGDELPQELRSFIAKSETAARAAARLRWAVAATVMLCLAVLSGASIGALYVAVTQRNEALISQSRFLARDSRLAVSEGNATLGTILALTGLPRDLSDPDRPLIKESEYALQEAFANRRERFILSGHAKTVWSAQFSFDSTRLLTASDDSAARLWNATTGAMIRQFASPEDIHKSHGGRIWSARFSRDGKHAVTASDDETARVWDTETGALVATLKGHTQSVNWAEFSPDGARVVTASDDWTARIWSAQTGEEIAVLRGHKGLITSAHFSPDGARIVTTSTDKTARLWDAQSQTTIEEMTGHEDFVWSAAFARDGKRLLTASWDKTVRLWNGETGESIGQFKDRDANDLSHRGRVWSAAFSPDGEHVVTASEDGTARIWDTKTTALKFVLKGHEESVTSAVFSADGTLVITSSDDKTAQIWNADTGGLQAVLRGHQGPVMSAEFSPDGKGTIATASTDNTAHLWSLEIATARRVLRGHSKGVTFVAISPTEGLKRVVSTAWDGTARIWNGETGELVAVLPHQPADGEQQSADTQDTIVVNAAAFSPDGKLAVTAASDKTARMWDLETGAEKLRLPRDPADKDAAHGDWVTSAAFSPDGGRVATASRDAFVRIWNAQTGDLIRKFKAHEWWISSVVYSRDGKFLLTGAWDETARVWDGDTGTEIHRLAHPGRITAAAFSPDGKRVVTSSWNGAARVWTLATQQYVELDGHKSWVLSAAFSNDGRYVVTTSRDQTGRVWDAESGNEIIVLRGHTGWVNSAQFSADDRQVVTAGDRTVRVWDIPLRCQALIDAAAANPLRGPTEDERVRYFLKGMQTPSGILSTFDRLFETFLGKSTQPCG